MGGLEVRKSIRLDVISITKNELRIFLAQCKDLLTNWIFIFTTLTLCCTYFVVTGIQFWMTVYLIKVLKQDPKLVSFLFALCSITAPIPGAALGGYLTDKNVLYLYSKNLQGGYKGKNVINAIKICLGFGTLAYFFAAPIGFLNNMLLIMPLLWCLLFFGAALVPIATGVVINSVSREHQVTSSAMSQLIFNLGGFFSAPIISALVMEQFKDEIEGMVWGFRVCLWWSLFGVFYMTLSWIAAVIKFKNYQLFYNEKEKGKAPFDFEEQEFTVPELHLEILRRRMHSQSF